MQKYQTYIDTFTGQPCVLVPQIDIDAAMANPVGQLIAAAQECQRARLLIDQTSQELEAVRVELRTIKELRAYTEGNRDWLLEELGARDQAIKQLHMKLDAIKVLAS